MSSGRFDILVVADARFSGGTATSLITDVQAFSALGLRTGIAFVESRFLTPGIDKPNPALLSLVDLPNVARVEGSAVADTVFFHHPLAFFHGFDGGLDLSCRRAVMVAHHPAFRGDGSLEYSPIATNRRIRAAFGCTPWWAPISGELRRQLRCFQPFITLTQNDWTNSFRTGAWRCRAQVFQSAQPVVGRHSRPDRLKWPENKAAIESPLSLGPGWKTRVMGVPKGLFADLGVDAACWDVLPFNAVAPRDFLEDIDVFSYFYHPRWVEAFGRTVAEAILMERPCVLDPRLEPNFGDLADYCRPDDAPALLERLRAAPAETRARAAGRRNKAARRFDIDTIEARLDALKRDPGSRSRKGAKAANASVTTRKLIGLWRRQKAKGGSV